MARIEQELIQRRRLNFMNFTVFLIVGTIIVKLVSVQVVQHGHFLAAAQKQQSRKWQIPARRGEIYVEDQGQTYPLALNQTVKLLYADPRYVADKNLAANKLAPILGMSVSDLYALLNQPGDYVVLNSKLTSDQTAAVTNLHLSGLVMVDRDSRFYPEGSLAAQVLGFVNSDGVGQYGIEGYFNDNLAGVPGLLKAKTDTSGVPIETVDNIELPPQNGNDYVLTLDRNIQAKIEPWLKDTVDKNKAASGSIVIMDPSNGKVVAMANYPTFDPNNYAAASDYSVFKNAAVTNELEPGSVFKTVTLSAGIDTGKIKPDTTYNDTGSVSFDGYTIRNAENGKYGVQNMVDVLQKSLNTGAVFVLEMLGDTPNKITKVGKELFASYIKRFGFGTATGIEQVGEASGSVPAPDSASSVTYANMAFGQGLGVTALQMTQAVAAIANGGKLWQPYLVDKTISADGQTTVNPPKLINGQVISANTAAEVRNMMIQVVQHGSGYAAKVPGYQVAGKTGTAQVASADGKGYDANKNIGSFVGFAPVGHPRFVAMVVVNYPQTSGFAEATAAPLFGKIASYLLQYYGVPPGN